MAPKILKTALLTAAVAVAWAGGALAPQTKQLRVKIPVIGMNFLPLFVAVDKGLFAKEGFDVEVVSTSGDEPPLCIDRGHCG